MWNFAPKTATKLASKEQTDGQNYTLGGNYQLADRLIWLTAPEWDAMPIGKHQGTITNYRKAKSALLVSLWNKLQEAFLIVIYEPEGSFHAGQERMYQGGTQSGWTCLARRSIPHYSVYGQR